MEPDDHEHDKTRTHLVLTKGTEVGHYRIVERIGVGGMGEVYLALDTRLQRQVVLKFLLSQFAADKDFTTRFTREAQAAAGLNHPNIVTVHEVGDFRGRPFFVTEYVDGSTIAEFIKKGQGSIEEIVELVLQVCDGLQEAHAAGIIHRDIKPDNILLDHAGRPKLADFGLAVVEGGDRLTRTGTTAGTVGYMAPEQIQGKKADQRSDLFSLGVVLYEALTGHSPFRGDSEAASLNAVINVQPDPVARYKAGVSPELERIVGKLLEKDPDLRYQTAAGVSSDLKRLTAASVAVSTDQVPPPNRLGRILTLGAVALVVVVSAVVINRFFIKEGGGGGSQLKMLAVLPFENHGAVEDEYFADGITDEILTTLARLSGLGVISSISARKYKGHEKSMREIGRELGVEYLLVGSIRWAKTDGQDRVRINPQLIRVADDVNLWAESYDEVLKDIFAVQLRIAEQVATALDITLLESERHALKTKPTDNPEAYDYYLRGNQYYDASEKGLSNAEVMYKKAIELEPEFALALAKLGMVHTQMYWYFYDRTSERLAVAKEAVDRALAISPNLPEGRYALGWFYYHGVRDYDLALAQFAVARKAQPNNSRLLAAVAFVQRRQGRWETAEDNFRKVIKLNPRDAWQIMELATTLVSMRKYEQAERFFNRALNLAPDMQWCYFNKSLLYLLWEGDTQKARAVIGEALSGTERGPALTYLEVLLDIIDEKYEHALSRIPQPGEAYVMPMTDTGEYYLMKANVYHHYRPELQEIYFDSARVFFERKVQVDPDEAYLNLFLGRAYAGLGRGAEAISAGRRAVESLPVSVDAYLATDMIGALAEIYTNVGEYDQAFDQLDYLLSIPAWISVPYLKILPDFAPLQEHPRFAELLAKYQ